MPSVENLLGINLQKCTNMVRLKDKRHGGFMFVPCGHCTNCVTNYRNNLARRLDLEREGSVSSLFFTLTYDNVHIPTFTPTYKDLDGTISLMLNKNGSLDVDNEIPLPSHLVPSLSQLCPLQIGRNSFTSDTYSYCKKSDFQKFLKRLRRLVEYDSKNLLVEVPKKDRTLRYFLCTEYGPKTYRAHAHGILFFQNKHVSDAVEKHYIFDAWKFCSRNNLRCAPLIGGGSSYVSKYVNKHADYPSILQMPFADTFYLSSRRPAIGCAYLNKRHTTTMLKERDFTISRPIKQQDNSVRLVTMPLPKQVSSYYFPKCFRFVSLDRRKLCNIYGSKIAFSTNNQLDKYPSLVNEVIRKYSLKSKNSLNTNTFSDCYDVMLHDEIIYGIPTNRLCAERCFQYCNHYNVTVEQYVDDLLAYHAHNASEGLRMFTDFLNDHSMSLKSVVMAYSSAFFNLPEHADLLVFNKSNLALENLLNDYNLTLFDLYDSDGNLLNLSSFDYKNSEVFKKHCDKIHQINTDFERKRFFAHLSNINKNYYEAF